MQLLEAISSNADVIDSLRNGPKHPKEMATEFGISRVAVDKRLKKLDKLRTQAAETGNIKPLIDFKRKHNL